MVNRNASHKTEYIHSTRSPRTASHAMRILRIVFVLANSAAVLSVPACGSKTDEKYGAYELVGTYYDGTNESKAKDHAADVLTKLGNEPNICMVGLWAY